MVRALVCCRAGVGSSMMLKIKVNQVIRENNFPITVEHANIDAVPGFPGDLIIALIDVADELKEHDHKHHVIGIKSIVDKNEIKHALETYLQETQK